AFSIIPSRVVVAGEVVTNRRLSGNGQGFRSGVKNVERVTSVLCCTARGSDPAGGIPTCTRDKFQTTLGPPSGLRDIHPRDSSIPWYREFFCTTRTPATV